MEETLALALGDCTSLWASTPVANFQHPYPLSPAAAQTSGLCRVRCPIHEPLLSPLGCPGATLLQTSPLPPSLLELVFWVGSLADKSIRHHSLVPGNKKAERIREGQILNREVREASQRK